MKRINEIGKFVLINDSSQIYALQYGTNLIGIKGNKIFIGEEAIVHRNTADAIFTISFTEKNIVLMKSNGKVKVNIYEVGDSGCELADNDIIITEKTNIQFKFICNDLDIENLIDVFMDGNLYYSINMDNIFYEYAKILKITDKEAISNVMAAIDIPEIDKL